MDDARRNGLVENDLDELVYVDQRRWGEIEIVLACEKRECACRYHTRYTRGRWVSDRWSPLAALVVYKVSIQKNIAMNQLAETEITEIDRGGLGENWVRSTDDGDLGGAEFSW